jgi:hypothetical protein
MDEPNRNPVTALLESQWLGIGIGMVLGALGSLHSVRWLIVVGWIIICIDLFRHDLFNKGKVMNFFANIFLSGFLALIFFVGWRLSPKPAEPLTVKDVREAVKDGLSQNPTVTVSPQSDKETTHLTTKAELAAAVRAAIDQYKSSETATTFSNLTREQLAEQAKSTASEALSKSRYWSNRLTGMDDAMKDGIQFQSRPDPDHPGKFITGMDPKDVPAFKKKAQQEQEEFSNEERKSTRNLILRVCGLRAEIITNRLSDRDLKGIPFQNQQKKKDDELCAKSGTSNYGASDLGILAVDLDGLQTKLTEIIAIKP